MTRADEPDMGDHIVVPPGPPTQDQAGIGLSQFQKFPFVDIRRDTLDHVFDFGHRNRVSEIAAGGPAVEILIHKARHQVSIHIPVFQLKWRFVVEMAHNDVKQPDTGNRIQ